jgi:two-component system response regulator HydG
MAETEEAAIREALDAAGGHRKKAAEMLGIGERTLYDKLRQYGIK